MKDKELREFVKDNFSEVSLRLERVEAKQVAKYKYCPHCKAIVPMVEFQRLGEMETNSTDTNFFNDRYSRCGKIIYYRCLSCLKLFKELCLTEVE